MPAIEPFTTREERKSWGRVIVIAETPNYVGKILERYPTGQRDGLQYHPTRDETFYLFSGRALVYFDDGTGIIEQRCMFPGDSFHVPPGAVHSVQTQGLSIMFEVSCGPIDERSVPVEARYADQMRALGASPSTQDFILGGALAEAYLTGDLTGYHR